MIALVIGYSKLVHKASCYAIKGARVRGIAPEIDRAEVPEFLKARKLEGCGACLPIQHIANPAKEEA